jgi:DNA-binding NarL/FixJ family response regulator
MSDRPLKLLLIDQDPIFQLGLRVALEEIHNIQVVSTVETDTAALQVLAELAQQDPNQVNLVILELGNDRSTDSQQQGLQLCRQLKTQYPNLPILLFSSMQKPELLLAAKSAGVDGYCPKGTSVIELVAAMEEVVAGGSYWLNERATDGNIGKWVDEGNQNSSLLLPPSSLPFARLRHNWHLSGISYINATLKEVTAQLSIPGLPLVDKAVLAGQRRELLAARWLLNHLLISPQKRQQKQPQQFISSIQQQPTLSSLSSTIVPKTSPPLLSPRALQAALFSSCVTKLQFSLHNLTDVALEIDIFREEKKRELLYLILQKLAQQLDELRIAQITTNQLGDLKNTILLDLWQSTITDFFGKFSRLQLGKQNIEIVNLLLQNPGVVQTEIFNKIPLVVELFAYLIFQVDLYIDNTSFPAGSSEAKSHAEMILENLLIQVANGVVQPLLNSLADVEIIKQNFYDRKLISTRDIERFRNDLSWKYRLNNYVKEAQRIFESRYELFVLAPRGIAKISIYAPRGQELAQLSGIPLVVTLILEFRDAIAPRLQSLLSFLGSGFVFILTQIIGRGLGLIGRGILQGIGSVSLQEKNFKRNSDRQK